MKFTITVETDNAIFEDGAAGALRVMLLGLLNRLEPANSGVIRDANGNTVGHWEWR